MAPKEANQPAQALETKTDSPAALNDHHDRNENAFPRDGAASSGLEYHTQSSRKLIGNTESRPTLQHVVFSLLWKTMSERMDITMREPHNESRRKMKRV